MNVESFRTRAQVTGRAVAWMIAFLVAAGPEARTGGPTPPEMATPHAEPQADVKNSEPNSSVDDDPRLDRESLIREVLERNPSIEAARQAWQAALARYPQAKSLTDPMFSYGVAPSSIGAEDVRFGQDVQWSQRFPYPGSLRLRGEIAQAEGEVAAQDLQTVRLRLATLASILFDDYYFVHRALRINEEHIQLLESFKRIATVYYEAGSASQQDPLQAEVEVAHLLHRGVVLEAAWDVLVAQINALLHRRSEKPLPPPPDKLPEPERVIEKAEALQEQALSLRPELGASGARIRSLEAGVSLKKLDLYPDFEAMTSYNSMWNTPEHRWVVGVGINVPIWRKRIRAGIAEAAARLKEAKNEQASLEDEVLSQVQQAHAHLGEAYHVIELYRSRLLPASHDQVEAALAGFKSGRNSFLALIEAEKNQRTVELNYEEALAGFYRNRAELDRAVGRLPASPERPDSGGAAAHPPPDGTGETP